MKTCVYFVLMSCLLSSSLLSGPFVVFAADSGAADDTKERREDQEEHYAGPFESVISLILLSYFFHHYNDCVNNDLKRLSPFALASAYGEGTGNTHYITNTINIGINPVCNCGALGVYRQLYAQHWASYTMTDDFQNSDSDDRFSSKAVDAMRRYHWNRTLELLPVFRRKIMANLKTKIIRGFGHLASQDDGPDSLQEEVIRVAREKLDELERAAGAEETHPGAASGGGARYAQSLHGRFKQDVYSRIVAKEVLDVDMLEMFAGQRSSGKKTLQMLLQGALIKKKGVVRSALAKVVQRKKSGWNRLYEKNIWRIVLGYHSSADIPSFLWSE